MRDADDPKAAEDEIDDLRSDIKALEFDFKDLELEMKELRDETEAHRHERRMELLSTICTPIVAVAVGFFLDRWFRRPEWL